MNKDEILELDNSRFELENRIQNLLWTVSGDYGLEIRPDVSLFLRSESIALYDGIKQGAFARYYDKECMGLYLVKKVFLQADEGALTLLAQLLYRGGCRRTDLHRTSRSEIHAETGL